MDPTGSLFWSRTETQAESGATPVFRVTHIVFRLLSRTYRCESPLGELSLFTIFSAPGGWGVGVGVGVSSSVTVNRTFAVDEALLPWILGCPVAQFGTTISTEPLPFSSVVS